MRMRSGNEALSDVIIYLTEDEAQSMIGALQEMLADPKDHHRHLNDEDYQHEITVTIYRPENLHTFDERSRRLILEDK